MTTLQISQDGQKEKSHAAGSSVLAAIGLTLFKLIVGLATGSLGILAEAAHSALDLAATIMTYFAVKVSDKPADHNHLYGHGKVENLSALFEILLLLATCAWISYEAIYRIFIKHVDVEVSIWSFVVMITSIAVDISRSRVLSKAAKKYGSLALEADALHFSTDVFSSAVVILGLIGVVVSRLRPSFSFMHETDSIAALIVVVIVIYVTIKLGIRTIHGLTDVAPYGLEQKIIETIKTISEVKSCHKVRVRSSGPQIFVDIHVLIDGEQSLSEAHKLTEKIERKIQEVSPNTDVTVHPEPYKEDS